MAFDRLWSCDLPRFCADGVSKASAARFLLFPRGFAPRAGRPELTLDLGFEGIFPDIRILRSSGTLFTGALGPALRTSAAVEVGVEYYLACGKLGAKDFPFLSIRISQ